MKNIRLLAVIAGILFVTSVLVLLFWKPSAPVNTMPSPAEEAVAVPQAPAQTTPPQQSAIQPEAAPVSGGEATPEFVTEPVTEQAEDLHQHDEAMPKPSPEIVNAIREIRKPVEGEGQMIENPDGSVKVNLGNRFRSVPIATIDKDGKVHVDYHGEKYAQDNQPVENQKSEEKIQEAQTP